ncbi:MULTISPECIES: prephenate dehydrogenase [Deefgea]|uniref:Prephenate dehydrogenase/arogenate dehydrogenase family protein n=1 Tax=Deefgea chitinilytica TaxID=570276 RepID=A0ABS2C969_9NEIS|nr:MULTISPECIES: prephenate dehydrogenase/arogenate dehydrogenase family protein [Deefgea]MBM5570689.1 prephenate dehydrogenase/arogenate dehydrogenase family protein [Deefgea chitinilytica]MBM9887918.1 prephenate dehydrogenase/arogenate dehydrogenase family protein [Deefgea sp. CFH1-16]
MQSVERLVLLGTGLISGSFALALKRARLVKQVVGVGRSIENLTRALELGVVDAYLTDAAAAVRGADLVLLGTPVGQMGRLMQQIAPHLSPNCVVTDGGSTKQDVCALFREHLPQQLASCVPGHPIAGSDLSGASAAQFGLYEGRRVVLTPLSENNVEAIERVRQLWQACGATVYEMSAEQHDGIFSAVSHAPHLLSFAYMNSVLDRYNAKQCLDFAASGFRDFTRIAGSHPDMWRDIALANRSAVLSDLKANIAQLNHLVQLIEQDQALALTEYIQRASQARIEWGQPKKE